MKHLIGTGQLNWARAERQTDRYGSVALYVDATPGAARESMALDAELLAGRKGKIIAEVVETRASEHIGDLARGIFPETPDVGELIELGEGLLFTHDQEEHGVVHHYVGLTPIDGRETDWLDPHKLYRVHQQTVRLYFEDGL